MNLWLVVALLWVAAAIGFLLGATLARRKYEEHSR